MTVHRLSRDDARRVALRAQLLDAERPTDLVELVHRLVFLQIDPTAAIAPNADLVAWSRMGARYQPSDLTAALQDRRLVEIDARIRTMSDIGVQLAANQDWVQAGRYHDWAKQNARFERDILRLITDSGPLMSRDIPDTSVVGWGSSGWTDKRNVSQMLQWLTVNGKLAISGRRGKQRLFDLAERVYPADLRLPSVTEAQQISNERRLSTLGIARSTGTALPFEPVTVADAGEPAVVDGVKGEWRVDPQALAAVWAGDFAGRTALLSPFDRLIYDRVRAQQLWDFDYALEMYKPKDKRRWGYYALPIVHHDQLVGKLDATADRKASVFRIHAIHADVRFTRAIDKAVRREIGSLADWLGLQVIEDER